MTFGRAPLLLATSLVAVGLLHCGDSGGSTSSGSGGSTSSSSGGVGGSGTTTSTATGTGGDCGIPECFAAVECVEQCGGPVVASSCCPCDPSLIDTTTCPATGSGGAGGGAGGN